MSSSDPTTELAEAAQIHRDERTGAVVVTGEVDVASAPALRDALYAAVDTGVPEVVVDVSGLEFIDSSGLGVLVGGLKRARERGGDMVLAGLRPPARRVFEVTRLDRLFELRDAQG